MASANAEHVNNTETTNDTAAERIAEAAHAKIDEAARIGAKAETKLRDAKQDAVATASEAKAHAADKGASLVAEAENKIKSNPLAAAGTAFAVGFVVSALLRK